MRVRRVSHGCIDAYIACCLACHYRSASRHTLNGNTAAITAAQPTRAQTHAATLTSSGDTGGALAQAGGAAATGVRQGREAVWQVPGKHKRVGGTARPLRAKKRPPWGVRQLRDSWSEDAMATYEKDSLGERTHRRYRYHPDESQRRLLRWLALSIVPMLILVWCVSYYQLTGKAAWKADVQHLLNLLRVNDTSPRSRLYLYRLDECDVVPDHIRLHRAIHWWERQWAARLLHTNQSAFTFPSEDLMRQIAADLDTEIDATMADAQLTHASEVRFAV